MAAQVHGRLQDRCAAVYVARKLSGPPYIRSIRPRCDTQRDTIAGKTVIQPEFLNYLHVRDPNSGCSLSSSCDLPDPSNETGWPELSGPKAILNRVLWYCET